MLLVLLLSWLLLGPALAASVTLFVLAVIGAVPLLAALSDLVRKPTDLPLLTHLSVTANALGKQSAQFLCTFIFLPYEAFISVDAIVRTLVRMLWTKTKMLEWKTSSDANLGDGTDLPGFFRTMWFGPALAVAAICCCWLCSNPSCLLVAGPLLGLWLVSPLVAWWLSRTLPAPPVRLSDSQRVFLRKLSRRTWRYFEVFVTAEENWLPPDNYPGETRRRRRIAHQPDQHRRGAPGGPGRLRLRLLQRRPAARSHQQDVRHPGPHGALSRPLLQLVRHALAQAACRRCTSPRWTAATWSVTCWCSAAACWN